MLFRASEIIQADKKLEQFRIVTANIHGNVLQWCICDDILPPASFSPVYTSVQSAPTGGSKGIETRPIARLTIIEK